MSKAAARVVLTEAAAVLLRRLANNNGALMIHQSGGCCDGSSPMCYSEGEFIVGDRDVLLGVIDLRLAVGDCSHDFPCGTDAVPVWISDSQFQLWKHTQLILDVVPGRGAGFSLESPERVRFISRARVFDDSELAFLDAESVMTGAPWAQGGAVPTSAKVSVITAADQVCVLSQ
ncbi:MAG: DUF779 domain-containing protein [Mycobacteriaceae bacterium]